MAVSLAGTIINAASIAATMITTSYYDTAPLILSSAAAFQSNIGRDQGGETQFLTDTRAEFDEVVHSIAEHQHMSQREAQFLSDI